MVSRELARKIERQRALIIGKQKSKHLVNVGVSELFLEKGNDFLVVMQLEAVNLLLLCGVDENDATR